MVYIKYGLEKFFLKNFEMYDPSVAGSSKTKGKITIENINQIFPMLIMLISKLGLKKIFYFQNHFVEVKKNQKKQAN